MTANKHLGRAGTCFAAFVLLAGCDRAPTSVVSMPSATPVRSAESGNSRELKQRQADFLNRIRAADPGQRTIERALLNEQNELGLILDRSVPLDKISDLMRGMLTEMAQEYPGQDLTILAYAPSEPPRKIGTARLDARTRDMTYTAEQ